MRLAATLTLGLLAMGCSCGSTHGARDGAVEQDVGPDSCAGPMPTDCFTATTSGDCRQVTASCEADGWDCPQPPPGIFCEGVPQCLGDPRPCHADLGRGCCGDERQPFCAGGEWTCPLGSIRAAECDRVAPACEGCSDLSQAECVGDARCVPTYRDSCCDNTCDPTFPCDACLDYGYRGCVPEEVACGDFFCEGPVYDGRCEPRAIDCAAASPTNETYCDVPGCVVAIESGCSDDCDTCVPLEADSCSAECDGIPPECPAGMVARSSGGCYTGDCIQAVVCANPD